MKEWINNALVKYNSLYKMVLLYSETFHFLREVQGVFVA
jgi:hypothetical protein